MDRPREAKPQWRNPVEMKRDFPSVDPAMVKSGHTVYVFNIRRNEFRLIAAVHFNRSAHPHFAFPHSRRI